MNIGNCPECGKLYVKTAFDMCADCYREEEKNEVKVAEYVRDHPRSSIEKIHEATGVKEKTIFRMIKSGRFVDVGQIAYPCQSCNSPIFQGRICDSCNSKLIKQVKESEEKRAEMKTVGEAKKTGGKHGGMYTKNM